MEGPDESVRPLTYFYPGGRPILVRILGTAAGGGIPQWNCRCRYCEAARRGILQPRLQASAALSPDGTDWYLINATPDLTHQLARDPRLHPRAGVRQTPFKGVLLTDAELDHTLGLAQLREGGDWTLFGTAPVIEMLEEAFPLLPLLRNYNSPAIQEVALGTPLILGPSGARIAVRWVETGRGSPKYAGDEKDVVGAVTTLIIEDLTSGRSIAYAPGVAELTDELFGILSGVEAIWFDGTFWTEDEFPRLSGRPRSARDMGHIPIGGAEGSAAWLAQLPAALKRYVHINNTNPVLDPTAGPRQQIRALGLDLAEDGDELSL